MKRTDPNEMSLDDVIQELNTIIGSDQYSDYATEDITDAGFVDVVGIPYQISEVKKGPVNVEYSELWPHAHMILLQVPSSEEIRLDTEREFLEKLLLRLRVFCEKNSIRYWEKQDAEDTVSISEI